MISYISNVNSDIQQQFNTISSSLNNISKNNNLLSSNNIWINNNNFTATLQISGIDVLSRISTSVNSLLSSSNTWTNTNNFSTLQISGIDVLSRITTSVNNLLSSSNTWTNTNNFSTLNVSGTSILTIITNYVNNLLSSSNTWSGSNTFGKIHSYNSPIFVKARLILIASDLNIGQYIELIDNGTVDNGSHTSSPFSLYVPDPSTCQCQVINMFVSNQNTFSACYIYNSANSNFLGRFPNTGNSFAPQFGGTYLFISNYYNWVIM